MQIGLIWLIICSSAYLLTDFQNAYFISKRVYCAKNMETIASTLSMEKNITAQNWFTSIKNEVHSLSLFKCPGLGTNNDVSYLFVPSGINNDKYPILIEYFQNHLEKGNNYLFFTCLKESAGINIIFRNSKHIWLTHHEALQLEKQFISDKVLCYNENGKISNFYSAKTKCSKYIVTFGQAIFANQCLAIICIFIGIIRISYLKKPENRIVS
jgi:hypothetical protein